MNDWATGAIIVVAMLTLWIEAEHLTWKALQR